MALTDAQIAKQLADQLNRARGISGADVVQHVTYSSGASFTVKLRGGEEKEVTVADPAP